ncbi:cytochrome c biogenesis protein ResB [Thiomicrospira sp. ALE5]|uniref:cytochrome c biogenesis protein ResB n=1 Tax=Thiomicrospira sp. ALE5 TaxID=748650 RepID=UPI0008EA7B21|nr:cytochrome c biogenesis protein ResB [Thiomicrospira sp. ALE5]SFR56602.1 cytochrome c biogenesis protein [Thiomicrospira sp. ALE5]
MSSVNTTTQSKTAPKPVKKPGLWIEFLGSMNLAITLLVMLSIASVIGTVLQQDQVVQDYIIKFGPFWYEVYLSLNLYEVYLAGWFMLVLLFLLVSTGVCVTRNTPVFIKEMKQYSEKLSLTALKHQPNNTTFTAAYSIAEQQSFAEALLKTEGYKTRIHQRSDGSVTVAGLKGHLNRIGYFLSHVSIIIIVIGALMDSNAYLRFAEIFGNLEAETRSVPLDEVNPNSWLTPANFSYRGNVNIREGRSADVLFLPHRQGYLVQQLPFRIEVEDFRVTYYDNGMAKSYESDIALYSPDYDEPIRETIEVNYPLYYKNFAIYQASYGDGGSLVNFNVHALNSPIASKTELESAINRHEYVNTPEGRFRIEFNDFQLYNIVPRDEEEAAITGRKMKNNGPSVLYRVRNEQGIAVEYEQYMIPNEQEGRWFYMTGVRSDVRDDFRYLFVPADDARTMDRFFNMLALVNNPNNAAVIWREAFPKPLEMDDRSYSMHLQLMQQLTQLYRQAGFDGITRFIEQNVPLDEQEAVASFYFGQLANALQSLYLHVLEQEGVAMNSNQDISEEHQIWFEDALTAIGALHRFGSPVLLQLTDFTLIQSSGLQITKSPGKNVVYIGSFLLILGIFFMFYVRQRRFWVHIRPQEGHTEITLASKDNRKLPETDAEFEAMVNKFKA